MLVRLRMRPMRLLLTRGNTAFTGSKATCDAGVGGEFTAWDGYISGKNLELEKGKGGNSAGVDHDGVA